MKKVISILMAAAMLFSIAMPAFAANPLNLSNTEVNFENDSIAVDPQDSAVLMLSVEGLGTDPADNQISSVSFSSSDDNVAECGSYSASSYTPSGASEPTGLAYEVAVDTDNTGIAKITANVTDTNGNSYTDSCYVTVRGITVNPKNVTLEVGESCVVFADRYGFTEAQATKNLSWSKSGENTGWVSLGIHSSGRQNEAYYIKGNTEGTGTVTASLSGSSFSDTINVTVVSDKSVSIEQGGAEVDSLIDLSSAGSVTLDAVYSGFSDPTLTWESCNPDLVSVSASGDSAVISRVAFSDSVAAVKATVTDSGISKTKTVYLNVSDPDACGLRITGSQIENGVITVKQGDTLTLSAETAVLDSTATEWTATNDGGRAPVMLNSTVGKSIIICARAETSSPVVVTAANGGCSDTVYVNVIPRAEKSVRIVSTNLGADGVITLAPDETAPLSVELNGFSENPTVNWEATVAKNNENTSGTVTNSVSLSAQTGNSTLVTAVSPSLDFSRVRVSVNDGNTTYTDEIFVKVSENNIIRERFVHVYNKDAVTLSTVNGQPADWTSKSQKTYFGSTSQSVTHSYGTSSATVSTNGITNNPTRITAQQDGYTDSVYVKVDNGSRKTVSFDLNGGYGKTPDKVIMSSTDTYQSFILPTPEAAFPSDDGEYVFYGWSDKANAAAPNSTGLMYFAGDEYSVPSDKSSVTLYAIWTKKAEGALFSIRLTGDMPAEPAGQSPTEYGKSCIYIENSLDPEGFYFNVNGVDSHLAGIPSDEDIIRALSVDYVNGEPRTYDPETDRVIWYVIKRNSDDAGGNANWHVDGVLVKGGRLSITYDKNIPVSNVSGFPNPPRMFYTANDLGSCDALIIENIPTCSSDKFIGWNTMPDGRGQWYTSTGTLYNGHTTSGTVETSITITEDTVLYAVWEGRLYYDINEDGFEDINDVAYIVSASLGEVTLTDRQAEKADLNKDGVIDGYDAAELDRILFMNDADKGDVDQDGDIDLADYAMVKAYISDVAVDENTPADLLDKSYLTAEYDAVKDSYPNGTVITQQYYCADYDGDKAVDAFDMFFIDKVINHLI